MSTSLMAFSALAGVALGQLVPRRSVALEELKTALAEQRVRIDTLNSEVASVREAQAKCEAERVTDRAAFQLRITELEAQLKA